MKTIARILDHLVKRKELSLLQICVCSKPLLASHEREKLSAQMRGEDLLSVVYIQSLYLQSFLFSFVKAFIFTGSNQTLILICAISKWYYGTM